MKITLGDAVAQCQELLDSIKNGALAAMRADFNALTTSLSQAIASANSAIPSAIDNKMGQVLYLDSVNGDDKADGSKLKPFKTLKALIDSVPFGGAAKIVGPDNQTINIDSDISQINKNIYFELRNLTINANAHYWVQLGSLKFNYYVNINQSVSYFIRYYGTKVMFWAVNITPLPGAQGLGITGQLSSYGDSMSTFQVGGQGRSTVAAASMPYVMLDVTSYDMAVLSIVRNIALGENVALYGSRVKSLQVGSSPVYLLGA